VGGVLSWLLECLDQGLARPEDFGVQGQPAFSPTGFRIESDSMHNAELGKSLLDSIIQKRGRLDLAEGARKFARGWAREKGKQVLDSFVFVANARKGWMVPNQYWTPGAISPMAIMGKYYMYYGNDFVPPRNLGRFHAERFRGELIMDNLGMCRFHRLWAEEMLPEIVGTLYGMKEQYLANIAVTASRINSRNSSIFWESDRNVDFVHSFLKRKREVDGDTRPEIVEWLERFRRDKHEAALDYWYEIHKGIHESLQEF
jgi:glyceraldehyde-3-phosphate dehydrogenase (ferredoxin)